jgi:hypothetical protein
VRKHHARAKSMTLKSLRAKGIKKDVFPRVHGVSEDTA